MATPSGTASRASSDRLPAHHAYLAAGTCLVLGLEADDRCPSIHVASGIAGAGRVRRHVGSTCQKPLSPKY